LVVGVCDYVYVLSFGRLLAKGEPLEIQRHPEVIAPTWARRSPVPLLEVRELRTGYGHQPVLHGVDLTVHERETAVILGLNGAGKTTTLMTLAGLHRRWGGAISYDGRDVQVREDSTTLVAR